MIGLLTTGRHDLSCLTSIRKALDADATWVTVAPSVCQSQEDAVQSAGKALAAILWHKDISKLVVLGDRSETLAACLAATILRIPIAHIHGGDVTLGAIDNVCRNAISQMATLHFPATERAEFNLHKMRVPGKIVRTGSPAIDLLMSKPRKRVRGDYIVLSYHPTTISDMTPAQEIDEVVAGIKAAWPGRVIYTGVNPDAGGTDIQRAIDSNGWETRRLSSDEYWDLLAGCACLVGNSSSGIIEAPALGVPVLNIGDRQKGRVCPRDVAHVPCDRERIGGALTWLKNVERESDFTYGDGKATARIVAELIGVGGEKAQ